MALAATPFFLGGSDVFDPFDGLDSILLGAGGGSKAYARDVANVPVDWKETPDAHIFKANLPGLSKEDVNVQIKNGRVLQISGERKKEETKPGETWHRVERAQGRFRRRFRLPENANVEEVKATMENGILTIIVPKVQKPPPKTIHIN